MPTKKVLKSKKTPLVADPIEEKEDGDMDISGAKGKIKKTLEIDAADILPEVDEKVIDDESATLALEDEDSEELPSLDDDELNPFGDKWEQ
jgi:hypothetical protein